MNPLCFVLMPFGRKLSVGSNTIDFDVVYHQVVKPACYAAEVDPIRADEENSGGIIHKPMFERLVLCEYAVADLTTANANVFYELGVRHAAKPRTTILMFAEEHGRLPFDVAMLRALPYRVGSDGKPHGPRDLATKLTERLISAKQGTEKDSPVFQLLEDYPDIAHEKTDVFREQVRYAESIKAELADARDCGREHVLEVESKLGPLTGQEAGIVIDLLLSYRAVGAWNDMIRVAELASPALAQTVMVREQRALALNRAGRGKEAEQLLLTLIHDRGESSETLGILGRVYKDRWLTAVRRGNTASTRGLLRRAVDAYRRGFEVDWRDPYPGVNALTLIQIMDPSSPDYHDLRAVVGYAVERKIASGKPDYWDYATRLELAVLDREEARAQSALEDALSHLREGWEAETTRRNLKLILEARGSDDPASRWVAKICDALEEAGRLSS